MPVYDGDLKELQRRAARRTQVQAQLRELETQRSALEARIEELAVVLHDERADVERLEAGGLTAFFYSLLGKGEEKLDKERREAAAAALKYESAARELAEAEDDIARLRAELGELEGAHEEYERALQARAEELQPQRRPGRARASAHRVGDSGGGEPPEGAGGGHCRGQRRLEHDKRHTRRTGRRGGLGYL